MRIWTLDREVKNGRSMPSLNFSRRHAGNGSVMTLFLMVIGSMSILYQKKSVDAGKKCIEIEKMTVVDFTRNLL